MRKLMTAVMVVAGMGLVAGCRDSRQEAQAAREDMARAELEAREDMGAAQQKLDARTEDARADAREDMQAAQEELAEEKRDAQHDLNEAQANLHEEEREKAMDAQGTGGSGMAASSLQTLSGTLASSTGKQLTLKDAKDAELELDVDDRTRVLHNGKQVDIDDFEKGTRLSATYEVRGDKKLARDVTITAPAAK